MPDFTDSAIILTSAVLLLGALLGRGLQNRRHRHGTGLLPAARAAHGPLRDSGRAGSAGSPPPSAPLNVDAWEAMVDPVYVLDRHGHLRYCNRAARELGGTGRRVASHLKALGFDNEGRKRLQAAAARLRNAGAGERLEVALRADGQPRVLELSLSPVNLPGGDRGVLMVGRDISRHREAEGTLADSEWLFRTITETAPLVIAINSFPEGRILYINPQSEDILDLPADELIGRDVTDLYYDPRERAEMVRILAEHGEVDDVELRLKNRRGRPVWVMLSGRTITFRGEQAVLVTYHDIDQRKRVEAELEKTHRAIQKQEQVKEELSFLANYDPLTRLPNRHLFRDRADHAMAKARRYNQWVGLLFLDLDGFKAINDTYGHETGDALLVAVAERLRTSLRESDTVARLGGDEFVILAEGLENREQAARTATQVLRAFREPFACQGRELRVTPSVGVSIYCCEDKELQTWLREADEAMYQAKRAGKNRFTFYAPRREPQPDEA